MMKCPFCDEEINKITIYEGRYWKITLNPNQYYLGRSMIILKRHLEDPLELSDDELMELISLTKTFVKVLKKIFQPDLFNYAMLGNIVRHLHLHIIPRYKTERIFEGIKFVDENWGKHYYPYPQMEIKLEILQKIVDKIKDEFIKNFQ
ncbi:MAG: HIT family protein [Candidatus Methanomethylicia archaeon]